MFIPYPIDLFLTMAVQLVLLYLLSTTGPFRRTAGAAARSAAEFAGLATAQAIMLTHDSVRRVVGAATSSRSRN